MDKYIEVCHILKENINLYSRKCMTSTPSKLKNYFAKMHLSAIKEFQEATEMEDKKKFYKVGLMYKSLFNDAARKETNIPKQRITVCWMNPNMDLVMSRFKEVK